MRMDTIGGDEPEENYNDDNEYKDREEDDQNSVNEGNSDDVDRLSVDLDDL